MKRKGFYTAQWIRIYKNAILHWIIHRQRQFILLKKQRGNNWETAYQNSEYFMRLDMKIDRISERLSLYSDDYQNDTIVQLATENYNNLLRVAKDNVSNTYN